MSAAVFDFRSIQSCLCRRMFESTTTALTRALLVCINRLSLPPRLHCPCLPGLSTEPRVDISTPWLGAEDMSASSLFNALPSNFSVSKRNVRHASRACDYCRKRKQRCNVSISCAPCQIAGQECHDFPCDLCITKGGDCQWTGEDKRKPTNKDSTSISHNSVIVPASIYDPEILPTTTTYWCELPFWQDFAAANERPPESISSADITAIVAYQAQQEHFCTSSLPCLGPCRYSPRTPSTSASSAFPPTPTQIDREGLSSDSVPYGPPSQALASANQLTWGGGFYGESASGSGDRIVIPHTMTKVEGSNQFGLLEIQVSHNDEFSPTWTNQAMFPFQGWELI